MLLSIEHAKNNKQSIINYFSIFQGRRRCFSFLFELLKKGQQFFLFDVMKFLLSLDYD